MRKVKLIFAAAPILGFLPLISLSSCNKKPVEQQNVTFECDEHCHVQTSSITIDKGSKLSAAIEKASITYDDGYEKAAYVIDGQPVDDNYVIKSDVTVSISSTLASTKTIITFSSGKHGKFEDGSTTKQIVCDKETTWKDVIKPTIKMEDGDYSFNNAWYAADGNSDVSIINPNDKVGSLSSLSHLNIKPHYTTEKDLDASNLEYSIKSTTDKTVVVTDIKNLDETCVKLPSTIKIDGVDYSVWQIDFKCSNKTLIELKLPTSLVHITTCYWNKLTYVNIPEGVTSIYNSAFYESKCLLDVTLPSTLTKIENFAFANCTKLTKVTIPAAVTEIGYGIYWACNSLNSIKVDENNNYFTSQVSGVEYNCIILTSTNKLIQACQTTTVIPEGITEVSSFAYRDTSGLTSISIPSSLTSFGDWKTFSVNPFSRCKSLKTITVDPSNTKFTSQDKNGKEVNILVDKSDSAKLNILSGCEQSAIPVDTTEYHLAESAFEEINIEKANLNYVKTIGKNAFKNCKNLKTFNPKKASALPESVCEGCVSLKTVILPDGLTVIGDNAFKDCISISDVNLENVNQIGVSAFENCSSLDWINLESVQKVMYTQLKANAFKNCSSLTRIDLGSKVTTIPEGAFYGCTKVMFDDNWLKQFTTIGKDAFYGWVSIRSISLSAGSGITELSGFANCPNLASISIESSALTKINTGAFKDCKALKNITINASNLTTIGEYAFSGCGSVNNIVLKNSLTTWPVNFSSLAFDTAANNGKFHANDATTIGLIKTNWTVFVEKNWTFELN